MATLISLNVGMPRDVSWQGRTVRTGIWKAPVSGPRLVRRLNVDGDGQGDLAGHGGEQRAVMVYQVESYRYWRDHLGRDDLEFGQFGENFTVDGLSDAEVRIGDRYRIGDAEFEVSQPRVTCYRVGLRLGEPAMPALLVAHHRPGFYLRVLSEGRVQAGDEIVLTRRGPHALSVADVDALLYLPDRDRSKLPAALDLPALSPGWQESFRTMLAAERAGGPVDASRTQVGWAGFRPLTVTAVVSETPTVFSVYLAGDPGEGLPRAAPGQFLTLRLTGAGDPAPVRSYSLSADPAETGYRISVKQEPRGRASSYLHTALRPGGTVQVAAPRGDFVLADGENPVLLISAGIGVTPVLAMLHSLAHRGSTRAVWWIHTTRNAELHAFAEEAGRLIDALPNARSRIFYTAPDGPPAAGITAGRLTADALRRLALPTDASAYLCGPNSFMTDVRAALISLGLQPSEIHTELFGALPAINPGVTELPRVSPHPPVGLPGTGGEVTFARSGLSVPWSTDYRSILELAEACDVPTRWSCRTGVCHTCATAVLAGGTRYATEPLEPPPPGQALLCCAVPTGELVLDL
jgi:ferredoxin-NADP reductase/MOSC domain-containing protein YiiM